MKFPWALSEVNPQTRAQVLTRHPARLLYRPVWLPATAAAPRRYEHHIHSNDRPPVPGEAIRLDADRFLSRSRNPI